VCVWGCVWGGLGWVLGVVGGGVGVTRRNTVRRMSSWHLPHIWTHHTTFIHIHTQSYDTVACDACVASHMCAICACVCDICATTGTYVRRLAHMCDDWHICATTGTYVRRDTCITTFIWRIMTFIRMSHSNVLFECLMTLYEWVRMSYDCVWMCMNAIWHSFEYLMTVYECPIHSTMTNVVFPWLCHVSHTESRPSSEGSEKGLGSYSMSFVIHRMTLLCHLSLPFDVIWRGNLAILYRYPSPNAIEETKMTSNNFCWIFLDIESESMSPL